MMRLMDACEGLGSDVLYDVRKFWNAVGMYPGDADDDDDNNGLF